MSRGRDEEGGVPWRFTQPAHPNRVSARIPTFAAMTINHTILVLLERELRPIRGLRLT